MNNRSPFLLDTHVWLNYLNASRPLRPAVIEGIEANRVNGTVFISVISIWEIAQLVRVKRISLNSSVSQWIKEALTLPGINLLPLTPQIAIDSVELPEPMHKDPADRILVATARIEQLTLVTRDRDILSFAKAIKLPCLQA
jgi:PIN domain nuclease of toxin-antitoxin system